MTLSPGIWEAKWRIYFYFSRMIVAIFPIFNWRSRDREIATGSVISVIHVCLKHLLALLLGSNGAGAGLLEHHPSSYHSESVMIKLVHYGYIDQLLLHGSQVYKSQARNSFEAI